MCVDFHCSAAWRLKKCETQGRSISRNVPFGPWISLQGASSQLLEREVPGDRQKHPIRASKRMLLHCLPHGTPKVPPPREGSGISPAALLTLAPKKRRLGCSLPNPASSLALFTQPILGRGSLCCISATEVFLCSPNRGRAAHIHPQVGSGCIFSCLWAC